MFNWRIAAAALTVSAVALPLPVLAQAVWTPGSEIIGQPITVATNGVTNTVTLESGGVARIVTPAGATTSGSWTIANQQLCLTVDTRQECWPYLKPFEAGQPVTLTSNCQSVSQWLAASTNPAPEVMGERG